MRQTPHTDRVGVVPALLPQKFLSLAMASVITFAPSGAFADEMQFFNSNSASIPLAAVTLPEGWTSSTTADGKEFYYNSLTKQSQWEPPQGSAADASKAVKRKKSGDLREVVGFESTPVIPIDKVTKKDAPKLVGKCGEGEFRFNSVECAPSKEAGDKAQTSKAAAADERNRMLQAAEMKALEKTKLFKDLQAKTTDPERIKQREADIERITAENDIGSVKAPWTSDSDRPPPAKLELPKLELPSIKLPSIPKIF